METKQQFKMYTLYRSNNVNNKECYSSSIYSRLQRKGLQNKSITTSFFGYTIYPSVLSPGPSTPPTDGFNNVPSTICPLHPEICADHHDNCDLFPLLKSSILAVDVSKVAHTITQYSC